MRCTQAIVAITLAVIVALGQSFTASLTVRASSSSLSMRRATSRSVPSPAALVKARIYLLSLLNVDRVGNRVATLLVEDPKLNTVAAWRSQDMISRHYFSHVIPGTGLVFSVLGQDHVRYMQAGENIVENTYLTLAPFKKVLAEINADFMHSPGHRANILRPAFTRVGIGIAVDPTTDTTIVTEVFVQPLR